MTIFQLLSNVVIVVLCAAAAIGCFVLNRRIRRLASSERGIGKAMSEMSRSVTQFETLLAAAEQSTREASAILDEQLGQACKLVARLEAIAKAAARPASTTPANSRKTAESGDPLADVVPKGASFAEPGNRRSSGGESAANGSALQQLGNLALQRRAIDAGSAAGRAAGA
jgi:hypothetical protein